MEVGIDVIDISEFYQDIVSKRKILNKIFYYQPYAAGSIMFTRDLYNRLGGFDENLAIEDWDFSIRAASATNFIGVHDPLFNYRSHLYNAMKSYDRGVTI